MPHNTPRLVLRRVQTWFASRATARVAGTIAHVERGPHMDSLLYMRVHPHFPWNLFRQRSPKASWQVSVDLARYLKILYRQLNKR